jgi:holo-[acyl-carrier protein] synthase
MVQHELLRRTVADFFDVPIEQVGPSFRLAGSRLQSSLARHVLDATIRRQLGVRCPVVYSAKTYGELANNLNGGPADLPDSAKVSAVDPHKPVEETSYDLGAQTNSLSCGIDVESVDRMPRAGDYWDHEFYQTNFTDAEIAYCVSQEHPAVHFAARWCAKEALKKCDPRYLQLDMRCIEVARDENGRPFLRIAQDRAPRTVPVALSMTHGPELAMAIVVCELVASSNGSRSGDHFSPTTQTPANDVDKVAPSRPSSFVSRMALLLSVISVVLAVIALVRSF